MFLEQLVKYTQFMTKVRQDKTLEEKCILRCGFPISSNILHIFDTNSVDFRLFYRATAVKKQFVQNERTMELA